MVKEKGIDDFYAKLWRRSCMDTTQHLFLDMVSFNIAILDMACIALILFALVAAIQGMRDTWQKLSEKSGKRLSRLSATISHSLSGADRSSDRSSKMGGMKHPTTGFSC